ncbi:MULTISPECIES: ParB N-terminal domain-containing protein [Bacillota]|uniref:ParB N-terminal domain-containing protein n=1 Tax=Bacillota TaxID=1239 RepID=UPI00067EC153|nr:MULTISPECIES: ParB N-terminal domain-containing protein [Bacillota]QGH04659.1 chromosome partitioning protein ParB [Streptococcus dysgalactiae subsp. dysgalactiae]
MSEKRLMSLDDMFGDTQPEKETKSGITEIEIEKLVSFSNHPFKLYEGERLNDMVESIKEFGVIVPIVVRPMGTSYQILSGHNRVNAAKLVGILKVPAVIKEGLTEDEATLIVTETNTMQRSFSDLLHSERAAVIYTRHKAMANQGIRNDLLNEIERLSKSNEIKEDETFSPLGKKLRTHEEIGETYKLSKNSIARYLRIFKLIDEIKEFLDKGEISIRAGVDLSYLSEEQQNMIVEITAENNYKIDMKKAEVIRDYSEKGKLNEKTAYSILSGELNKRTISNKPAYIKLKQKLINKYFKPEAKQPEIEDIIDKALKLYFETQGKEVLDE